jgi:flavin-dependent dehydrogenase
MNHHGKRIGNAIHRPAELSSSDLPGIAGRQWDVLVIGAGPAGAMAALLLARQGASVLIVDRSRFPRWKVCGCCLNGTGLAVLRMVGLGDLPHQLGAQPLERIELTTGRRKAVLSLPDGVSLSREALDSALIAEAIRAGAVFAQGTAARVGAANRLFRYVDLRSGLGELRCGARVVLVADGLAGQSLQALPEFRTRVSTRSLVGAGTVLDDGPVRYRDRTIYMACGEAGYVGLVRLEDGRLDMGVALKRTAIRREGGPGRAVAVLLRQSGLPVPDRLDSMPWRGTSPLTRRRSRVAGDRLFLLGDSAGYVEPFTGEGMAWALLSSVHVGPLALEGVRQWRSGLAARWSAEHRNFIRPRQRVCRAVSMVLKSSWATSATVRLLEAVPALADPWIRRVNSLTRSTSLKPLANCTERQL